MQFRCLLRHLTPVCQNYHIGDGTKALVESTKVYYAKKAAEWIQTDNVPTYLSRVEEKLGVEAARVKNYMNERTESPLLQQIEQVMLAAQQTKLIENVIVAPIIIGHDNINLGDNRYWIGQLDDIRIYNRALTQEEITYLYNN